MSANLSAPAPGSREPTRGAAREVPTSILLAGLIAFVVATSVPGFPRFAPLSRDAGVFAYGGARVLAGGIPYRDFWDHKPPVVFFVNALALSTGQGRFGIWVVETALIAASLGVLALAALRAWGSAAAVTAAAFGALFLHHAPIYEYGNFTELYAAVWSCAILAIVVAERRRFEWHLLAGILAGLVFLTKQSCIGTAVGYGCVLSWDWLRNRRIRSLLPLCGFTVGVALPVGACLLWFGWHGALAELWVDCFEYSRAYVLTIDRPPLSSTWRFFFNRGAGLPLLVAIGASAATFAVGGAESVSSRRRAAIAIAAAILVDAVLIVLPGRHYGHYLLSLGPSLALGLALLVQTGQEARERIRSRVVRMTMTLVVSLALLALAGPLLVDFVRTMGTLTTLHPGGDPVVRRLRQAPDDGFVFIWGAEPGYYFLAGRVSPTRYIYLYPLQTQGYGSAARIEELLTDLRRRPPVLIVDASRFNSVIPPLDPVRRKSFQPAPGYEFPLDPVHRWIEERYLRETQLANGWDVYVGR